MKALVLCGGYGTRLGPLCRDRPKPLLEVGGQALVEHALRAIAKAGIEEAFINLHYRGLQLVERLGNGQRYGLRLEYLYEPELLGTAGTARALVARCNGEGLLVHYGDILSRHPLSALLLDHQDRGADATAVVHHRPGSNSCVVLAADGRIKRFLERPTPEARARAGSDWAFSGICVLSDRCLQSLQALPNTSPCDLPRDVFAPLAPQGRLFAQRHSGYRCAVDSPARLESARRHLQPQAPQGRQPLEASCFNQPSLATT